MGCCPQSGCRSKARLAQHKNAAGFLALLYKGLDAPDTRFTYERLSEFALSIP